MIIWMIFDIIIGKLRGQNIAFVSIPGLCSATVVGLVVITPATGFVQSGYALLIGLIGGLVSHLLLTVKKRFFHIDDTLDVFTCHCLGGIIGMILTGLFSQSDVNSNTKNGAFYGHPIQLWYQILGILVTCVYSAVCTAAILLSMHFTIGIRINRLDQVRGLDNVAHGVIEQDQTQKLQQIKISGIKTERYKLNTVSIINVDREWNNV
jgi:Amt family ammonium transporter